MHVLTYCNIVQFPYISSEGTLARGREVMILPHFLLQNGQIFSISYCFVLNFVNGPPPMTLLFFFFQISGIDLPEHLKD